MWHAAIVFAGDNADMKLFPLFADLRGRPVLVVGGGEVAARKAAALLAAGADVTVVAPELHMDLRHALDAGRLRWHEGYFVPACLEGMWLAVAATADRAVNRAVADAGAARRCFVNVVDDPELSHFQVPAVVDRDPVTIAVSSAGAAPMFARRIRERLEALIDPQLGPLTALAAKHRDAIRQRFANLAARRAFYDRLYEGEVAALLRQGRPAEAESALLAELAQRAVASVGRIVVVGVGPGDPGSLTLAALRALNLADVLLVADGVPEPILALARKDASRRPAPAGRIESGRLLRSLAEAGQLVVYLERGRGPNAAALGLSDAMGVERVPGLHADQG